MSVESNPPLGTQPGALPSEVRNWAILCHVTALSMFFTGVGHILGPLIVWLIKRNEHPFIDANGKESVNFQISMTIYSILAVPLVFILIGFPILFALLITNVVCIILAAVKANEGTVYRYPITIRFIK